MRIRGLGVIEDAVLELSPGFTAVTGETGAGKTMVVTGLGLLFGGRSDSALVRPGAERASVEGRLVVDPKSAAGLAAAEAGAEFEPVGKDKAELIISRSVSSEGRSRASLGGAAVPIGVLGGLADDLVAMHGQSAQQSLLQPARQRQALDRYAGPAVAEALAEYKACFDRLKKIESTLDELTTRARERSQEADLLRFGLAEVERLEPVEGEDAELDAESERLGHADTLRTASEGAHMALAGSPDDPASINALSLVSEATRALEAARGHDPALAELAQRLDEASFLLADVSTELAAYADSIEADPRRLADVQQRISDLNSLMRKYGPKLSDVIAWASDGALRLAELEGDDDRIAALTEERTAAREELTGHAARVSAARSQAADKFAAAVTTELAELAMPHARVEVPVTQKDSADGLELEPGGRKVAFGPTGVDDVEIRLAPHPGAPFLPIAKGASGGELSRVMLAVEVVFAGSDPVPTFVFDEVDAGVGGKAAVEVGRRLARLARSAQVVVVTHLPQVAAFADRQLVVKKANDGLVTRSGVVVLDDAARRRELARMLAGLEESELGQAHADELLQAAAADRQRA
ncbi:DNA repair protein RecN (Recombination protein N) [Catenulispora sp. GAS73]|uniref:DNA repair protein RecN n=1 Tax=Catenulispora sp. GAS73 TaxID=3156269 RepID=UPI0035165423